MTPSEQNMRDLYVYFNNKNIVVTKHGSILRIINNQPKVWPDLLYLEKFSENETLEDLIACSKKNKLPILSNSLDSKLCDPINLSNIAQRWFGMTYNHHKFQRVDYRKDITTVEVNDLIELNAWLMNFESVSSFVNKELHCIFSEYLSNKNSGIKLFSFHLQNKCVGNSMLFESNDSVGLYLLNVKEEYRNKGIGSFIVNHAKHFAQIKNHPLCLQSTNDTTAMYQKFGFIEECTLSLLTFY